MKVKPSILPGFMELLPKEQRIFEDMVTKVKGVYESFGFLPMDTPIIEKSEVLLAKSQGETSKQVYRFTKGDKDMTLRYDLTVPFARYVAMNNNDLAFPFKRYQVGKVYRGERSQKGRYREFYQCDIDIVGKEKLAVVNDALVIFVVSQAFKAIGLESYSFFISNRKLMKGLIEIWQVQEKEGELLNLLDKFLKLERADFTKMLEDLIGSDKAKEMLKLIEEKRNVADMMTILESYKGKSDLYDEGLKEIKEVTDALTALGLSEAHYCIDLSIIRGLDYYTGTVFETLLTGNEGYGSICSGGRYEELTGCFTSEKYPGVGISIGITRLFSVLKEIGFLETYPIKNSSDYLILSLDADNYALTVYQKLQEKGYNVAINIEKDKLKKKMNYANKLQADKVIILGEEEQNKGILLVKDMTTGEQQSLSIDDL